MLEIHRRLKAARFEAKMVLQIHDELLFEAPNNEVADITHIVRQCMEHPRPLDVPLKVDIGTGASWAEAL
jgi:DNA polymerase-1